MLGKQSKESRRRGRGRLTDLERAPIMGPHINLPFALCLLLPSTSTIGRCLTNPGKKASARHQPTNHAPLRHVGSGLNTRKHQSAGCRCGPMMRCALFLSTCLRRSLHLQYWTGTLFRRASHRCTKLQSIFIYIRISRPQCSPLSDIVPAPRQVVDPQAKPHQLGRASHVAGGPRATQQYLRLETRYLERKCRL